MFSALKSLTSRTENGNGSTSGQPGVTGIPTMSSSLQKKFSKGVQHNMKIILKGDKNVGKSQLLRRLQGLPFVEEYTQTEEIQAASIQWNYKNSDDVIKVDVWEIVDKTSNKKSVPNKLKIENSQSQGEDDGIQEIELDESSLDVYKNTNGVIFVLDITKSWTFDYIKREINTVPLHIPVLIVGNHRDMGQHRAVATDSVHYFIESLDRNNIRYTESSMRNGFGLKYINKFFNLPFMQLQRETLLKQLETNKEENQENLTELDYYAESDDSNYDLFIENLSPKHRKVADAPTTSSSKANSSSKGNDSPSLDLSTGQFQPIAANNKSTLTRTANRGSKWDSNSPTRSSYSNLSSWTAGFLRGRRDKKKDKKSRGKKKDGTSFSSKDDKSDGDEKDESHKPDTPTAAAAEIDEEGFIVRPMPKWENDKSSFYSSSDSDSDEREKRLHVEIKPLNNGTTPLSASVDELRSTMETLTLSPLGMAGRKTLHEAESQMMKRSQSVSQQIGSSSPPSRHPYTPLSPPPPNQKASPILPANGSSSTSRYADLGDIFAEEIGELQPSLPPKASAAQRNTPTPTMSIPRPPSRPRPEGILQRNTSSPSPSPAMSRTESIGSLDSRSVGSHVLGSRGPSPLTIGMADSIPLAVAFHEMVHACFKGNDETRCQVKMTGDMMVSFPAGIIQVFASNPQPAQLAFQVRSTQTLDNLICNKELVNVQKNGNELNFDFNMSALIVLLKKHAEQSANASYFNVDILKYHITPKPGATSCPLHLVAFWKCEKSQTDLRIDYKYNSHAMAKVQSEVPNTGLVPKANPPSPALTQVCIAAPVDGGVKSMQSKPTGQWFPNTNRACWKLASLSNQAENLGVGSLRARFEITNGPSSQGTIAAQFSCENSTLSGTEFSLIGTGYRISLIKKRFVSGKYTCDTEDGSRYAVPPNM